MCLPAVDRPVQPHAAAPDQATGRTPREIGTRWRRLPVGRQALLALAHLRCGDTYAQLATGFEIGIATVYTATPDSDAVARRSDLLWELAACATAAIAEVASNAAGLREVRAQPVRASVVAPGHSPDRA